MAVDDAYTKSLLHFNGADASTTFTDESGKTWNRSGDAQIDTAQYKFGDSSGLFDGSDYISTSNHADWQLDGGDNANAWTIDFWVRFNGDPGSNTVIFCGQLFDKDNQWRLRLLSGTSLNFSVRSSGTAIVAIDKAWNPAGDTWYHIAIIKDGINGYMMFINGTQIGSTETDTSTIPSLGGLLFIGYGQIDDGTPKYIDGWVDEFRLSKGVARWTSNFTAPTSPYGFYGKQFQVKFIG